MEDRPTIWLLPIEPFEERYTADWYEWWPDELRALGWDVVVVDGYQGSGVRYDCDNEIRQGEFLDATGTWEWKGTQVANLAKLWPMISDGDVILHLDGWGPGPLAAAYMRDATGRRVKNVAYWHAGSYDGNDFLARKGMAPWGHDAERGMMNACDLTLVATGYHRGLIRMMLAPRHDPVVVGLPIHSEPLMRDYWTPWQWRRRMVVFPHRLAPEKQPRVFDELQQMYSATYPNDPVDWIWTKDPYRTQTKGEYYRLLGSSRVNFSAALQETFGIATQEAIALGSWAVVPDRLSYPETVNLFGGSLYQDLGQAVGLIRASLDCTRPATMKDDWETAIASASRAIEDIL